jgi:phosphate transport system substrate-binding protein
LLVLAGLALEACSAKPTVEVRVAGSSTVFKRMIEPLRSTIEKDAGLKVVPDIKGTGAGFISLLEGRTELLLSSAELPTVIDSARALGWKGRAEEAKGLHIARIHEERIIVIVNSDNPVDSVSTDNLVKILSGSITNWKEVGGEDLPIMVVVPEPGRATREVFARRVMKGVPFAPTAFDRQATGKADDIVRVNASAIAVTSHQPPRRGIPRSS